MKGTLKVLLRQMATILGLTILITFACLSVDSAYLSNPIGEENVGITQEDGISLPASSEITITADGIDPIRIDLKSTSNDFTGMLSVSNPEGKIVKQEKFALRYYPSTLFPNPAKWKTFMVPAKTIGTYRVYVSQNEYGKADFYAYQGPFVARMIFLPLFSALVLIVLMVTFSKKTKVIKTTSINADTVLECKTTVITDNTEISSDSQAS